MRIDTAQVAAAASPLTSSDIFSDVLVRPDGRRPEKPAAAPPAARVRRRRLPRFRRPRPPPLRRPARPAAESDVDKRLRDTLSGLNIGSRPAWRPKPAPRRRRVVVPLPAPPRRRRGRSSRPTPTSTG